jgi:hypothetical protein
MRRSYFLTGVIRWRRCPFLARLGAFCTRADEERAAMERKAAAEAALVKRIADFKKDAADLIASTSLPASDFQELRTLLNKPLRVVFLAKAANSFVKR